ncbi:MAG: alkylated DNA repair dioxygenase [Hyphomicrobiales bacterium]|nr:MAG: alkylated DNA repair dioxygenase [Hyphomicrobiales bacterium]
MTDTRLDGGDGLVIWPGRLDRCAQEALLEAIADAVRTAPFFIPRMPRTAKPFSVVMTNCGPLGWVADINGYRYQKQHPDTGNLWPPIPAALLALWEDLTGYAAPPEACLVNYYRPDARMSLHRDEDEDALDAPILSVSLGDTALFRIGGRERKGKTRSFRLASGDVLMLSGEMRHAYHGIDRLYPGTSTLLARHADLFPDGGRINLTLRRVAKVR